MNHLHGIMRYGACALALSFLLTACGKSPVVGPEPEPAAIEGIATPSSVAVVTATHAN